MELSGYRYKCAGGETWDSVALDVYDNENYAADLLSANPEHCRKSVFTGGELLYLPVIEVPEDEDEEGKELPETPPWKE